jgi:uncharacterized repeat protein (TIGR01451 family)
MADRPSRQLLVVPPRGLRWPYFFGATAGLSAGALVVWALGSVRPTARGDAGPDAAGVVADTAPRAADMPVSAADPADAPAENGAEPLLPVADVSGSPSQDESTAQPGRLAPAADAMPMSSFAARGVDVPADLAGDHTTDLEPPPAAARFPATGTARPLSRFSAGPTDPEPSAAPATAAGVPPDPFAAAGGADPAPVAPTRPAVSAPAAVAVATARPLAPLDATDPIVPTNASSAAGAPAETPSESAAFSPPDALVDPAPAPPPLDAPVSQATVPLVTAPVATVAQLDDPGAPIPIDAAPPTDPRAAATPAGSPFAAAPPLGAAGSVPPPTSRPSAPGLAAPGAPGSRTVTTGQGRPGPTQLDGVQTPQLTVEKRGPREVQVGQTCRYEVIVRNVGAAVAHDVTIHDTVPVGTTLVATSPPASPAGDHGTGDLVWRIGQLPPGSQARVAMELLPNLEGEVGSLASVSFRAEAGARARATKPDLALSAPAPQPVLVGGPMPMVITVTNPGTGTATGVVLEGVVPDGVTHAAGRELEFDVGRLGPGQSRSIDLELATTGPGVHQLQLVARADGGIEMATQVRLEVTAPTLDLAAEIPARRYLQRPAPCRLSMTNAGTAPAREVELAAQLPPGLKFIRTNNAGYYDERTHRVLWNLEELPAAETGTVELVVMPVELGPQKIVAAARAAGGLADQAVHTIEVEGLAALTFEVTDSEDPIEIGGLTEYVVRVANQGTKAASGVRLVATLLGDVEPVAAKGPVPHRVDNLAIAFDPLARLAPAEEAVYRVRVRGRRPGDQRVQVQLTSDDQPAPITKEEVTRVYADR